MLIHPMLERLRGLGLSAMAEAFSELQNNAAGADLSREDCGHELSWIGRS